MLEVSKAMGTAWKKPTEVLRQVTAVPTVFPSYDFATRVGGHPTHRVALVHGPSGMGKALAIDEPILTPCGWRTIGSLLPGDAVTGKDGKPHTVLGVFPQGVRQVYRVEMTDGTSVECCAEHLWFTTTKNEHLRGKFARGPRPARKRHKLLEAGSGSVKPLAQIMASIDDGHEVPVVAPIEFQPITQLPIDPYLLGVILGDASLRMGSPVISNPEADIIQRVGERLPPGDRLTFIDDLVTLIRGPGKDGPGKAVGSTTRAVMKQLGLDGKKSTEKHIPLAYLRASIEERTWLLRGLVDTDGHVVDNGCAIEYTTSSPALAEDFQFLARSLGGVVSVTTRIPLYTHEGERRYGALSARISVRFDNGVVPFASTKHRARWRERILRVRKRIARVEPTRMAECVCIAVDAPDHLYVTRDFNVTHNSQLTSGIGLSFIMRGHFFGEVDAERTSPFSWFQTMFKEHASSPLFLAARPDTYEDTVEAVESFCTAIGEAKAKGKIAPTTSGVCVVDSVRKLVPKKLADLIAKDVEKHGMDGLRGRMAQHKAALNSMFMDRIVPLLDNTGTTLILIARETDASEDQKKAGVDFLVGGGKALFYDASLVVRVAQARMVFDKPYDPDSPKAVRTLYGERHEVHIHKTKVSARLERVTKGFFHSSNGAWVPPGFDPARDLVELGQTLGVIVKGGSWLSFAGVKKQGDHRMVKALYEKPELLAKLDAAVRGRFDLDKPEEAEVDVTAEEMET